MQTFCEGSSISADMFIYLEIKRYLILELSSYTHH
uniref:Uncharacterized protein n=1 Tax=Arundo donax TaxID=35708 RepID=A0A0A9DZY8_ARUDO